MWRLLLLSLIALSQGIRRSEFDSLNQYFRSRRRVCGDNQYFKLSDNGNNFTLETSALPAHPVYRTNRYVPVKQDWTFSLPKDPVPLETPLCLPTGSPIGFARDGVPFYSALSDIWSNAVEGGCASQFDRCHGSVDSNNVYHYRELPDLNANCMDVPERNNDNVFLGVALDGFPIYYDKRLDTSTLDECNGKYMDKQNKRDYRYFITNTYPYTIGCFRGKVANITTLSSCTGGDGKQGSLCACVDLGIPGLSVGYDWFKKADVTTGVCGRRPYTAQKELTLVCNGKDPLISDLLPEDMMNATCPDMRAMFSLMVIYGLNGGMADWTGLGSTLTLKDAILDLESLMDEDLLNKKLAEIKWELMNMGLIATTWSDSSKGNKTSMWPGVGEIQPQLDPSKKKMLQDTLAQIWILMSLGDQLNNMSDPTVYQALKDLQTIMTMVQGIATTPMPPMPPMPSMPLFPAFPPMPGMPSMPGMPPMPDMPKFPAFSPMPGTPPMPGMPPMSGMPQMPGMPSFPSFPPMSGMSPFPPMFPKPGMPPFPPMHGKPPMPWMSHFDLMPGMPPYPHMPNMPPFLSMHVKPEMPWMSHFDLMHGVPSFPHMPNMPPFLSMHGKPPMPWMSHFDLMHGMSQFPHMTNMPPFLSMHGKPPIPWMSHFDLMQGMSQFPHMSGKPTFPPMSGMPQFPPMSGMPQFPPMSGMPQFPPMSGMPQFSPMSGMHPFPTMTGKPTFPPMSGMHPFQAMSRMPQFPAMSRMPQYPPMSGMPQFPPMQGMSPFPPMSGKPTFPPMSGMSQFPPMSGMPQFPPMQGMSPFPSMSGMPSSPPMPGMPQFPPMTGMPQFPPMSGMPQFQAMFPQTGMPPKPGMPPSPPMWGFPPMSGSYGSYSMMPGSFSGGSDSTTIQRYLTMMEVGKEANSGVDTKTEPQTPSQPGGIFSILGITGPKRPSGVTG